MDVRDFVTFNAEFPDDSIWDEQGNLLVPAGRTIADCISKQLQEQSHHCSKVFQHEFYGWAFDAIVEKNKTIWILIAAAEGGWLVQFKQINSLVSRFFSPTDTEGFKNIQNIVHATLSGNENFSDILWYTRKDYESRMGK